MFYRWQRYLPDDVALVPIRMPGREDRQSTPPYHDLAQLADDIAEAIGELSPAPCSFVGHSLGGYVAYEVAHRLVANNQTQPHTLVVAACGAPRPVRPKSPIGHLSDQEFLAEVSNRYDGIPEAVRNSPELLAMVLPPLRADIQMIEAHEFQPAEPLPIDILALGGSNDPGVAVHRLNEWRPLTSQNFTLRLFPGGHFFLHPAPRRESNSQATPAAIAMVLKSLPPASES